jgi:uncharacterized protein
MIAVDTHILVYAHRAECDFHDAAYAAICGLAEGGDPWGIPVACLHEFMAICTNSKLFKPASTASQAATQLEAWLESPVAHILHTGTTHLSEFLKLSRQGKLQGGQHHDARIAAICLENSIKVLWTADRDFSRFKTLKTFNPLL